MQHQIKRKPIRQTGGKYSNTPMFISDRPYGSEPRNTDEMLWLKHRRMLVDRMPGMIYAMQLRLCNAAMKEYPGYDPDKYQANVESMVEKQRNYSKESTNMIIKPNTAVISADQAEITLAAETSEAPEFLASQAKAIDRYTFGDKATRHMERAAEVREEFRQLFLNEDSFSDSGDAMLEIAGELEADGELTHHVDHKQLAADMETFLIESLFELAKIEDFLPDHLIFKTNLYKGYIDDKKKESFFGRVNSVRRAEFFEYLPQSD